MVNQIDQQYQAKDDRIAMHLKKVRVLLNAFETNTIEQVPGSKNATQTL